MEVFNPQILGVRFYWGSRLVSTISRFIRDEFFIVKILSQRCISQYPLSRVQHWSNSAQFQNYRKSPCDNDCSVVEKLALGLSFHAHSELAFRDHRTALSERLVLLGSNSPIRKL
jgi:hypothetical protein